jgi:8-oxo-dGTP diphosphatase
VQTVTCAVIERDGKILIARRKSGDQMAGKWEFPGGTIESGETPEQCLKRELLEELGVEIVIEEFICSSIWNYDHVTINLLAFKALLITGELTLHDHAEIRWVLPAELADYDFPEADMPIIRRLKSSPHNKSM